MYANWDIKARGCRCTRTGREFADGESFYTLLYREKDGYRREDLCEEAWRDRNDNIQPFSFWKSKFDPPPPPPPEPLPKNDAEGLLRRLLAEGSPATSNACYILALMLERKRVLRPLDSEDPALLVYEHVGTGETFVVQNPGLSLDQVPAVQREVAGLLAGGLPA